MRKRRTYQLSFSHLDESGNARMVDVTLKKPTKRHARARAIVRMNKETYNLVLDKKIPKGDVFSTARIAGIMAAKQTASLIPLCHPLSITSVTIDFEPDEATHSIEVTSTVKIFGLTGVEMEALTSVCIAALTIYDMCKAIDKGIRLEDIFLLEKKGGKSGTFINPRTR